MVKLAEKQVAKIDKKISIDSFRSIVILNVGGDKTLPQDEHNKNIYCIDDSYNIIWQIDAPSTGFERDSFVYMGLVGSQLTARNFSGFEY